MTLAITHHSTRVPELMQVCVCESLNTHMSEYASTQNLVYFDREGREASAERAKHSGAISSRVSELAKYPASFTRRDDVGFLVFSQRKQMPCVAGHEVFGVTGLGHS